MTNRRCTSGGETSCSFRRSRFIGISVALVFIAACASAQLEFSPTVRVVLPSIGQVVIAGEQRGEKGDLIFRTSDRRVIRRENFRIVEFVGGQGIAFRVLRPSGLPTPLIVAVGHQVGADGVNTEVALFAAVGRKLDKLWPDHRRFRFSQEGICVGDLGGKFGRGIAEFRMIEGSDCVMCPHRYQAAISSWSGEHLVPRATLATRKKYDTAEEAIRSLHFACKDVITSTVLNDN